jgi:glutaredoxin
MYGMQYEYVTVGESMGITEFLEMYPGTKTVPLIEVDGKKLGGYEELTRYVEETKNDYGHSI